jgi:hypothetical protein
MFVLPPIVYIPNQDKPEPKRIKYIVLPQKTQKYRKEIEKSKS